MARLSSSGVTQAGAMSQANQSPASKDVAALITKRVSLSRLPDVSSTRHSRPACIPPTVQCAMTRGPWRKPGASWHARTRPFLSLRHDILSSSNPPVPNVPLYPTFALCSAPLLVRQVLGCVLRVTRSPPFPALVYSFTRRTPVRRYHVHSRRGLTHSCLFRVPRSAG